MIEELRRYCLLPLLMRQWGIQSSSEDRLLSGLLNTGNVMDESLDDIIGIDMIRGYLNTPSPSSYERRLSEEEKSGAYHKAYSIWLSRMEKQME